MTRIRPTMYVAVAAALGLIALVATGCGGDDNGVAAATAPPTKASGHAATVGTANQVDLGSILVDSNGRTLYLFEKDSGTTSACSGACASSWPPLRVNGKSSAGSGVDASLLGTAPRSDGAPQITYNGHPLYRYGGDQAAGEANGQGSTAFGAGWFALTASGDQVSGQGSSSSSGISNGGGAGYGGGYQ